MEKHWSNIPHRGIIDREVQKAHDEAGKLILAKEAYHLRQQLDKLTPFLEMYAKEREPLDLEWCREYNDLAETYQFIRNHLKREFGMPYKKLDGLMDEIQEVRKFRPDTDDIPS